MDKGKVVSVLLTDLLKAFKFLSHELILAILNAFDFSLPALKLMHNYLEEQKKKDQDQPSIQFMGSNTIWGTSGVYTWTHSI